MARIDKEIRVTIKTLAQKGCSKAEIARDDQARTHGNAGIDAQVVRFGQVGAIDAQLARDGGQRFAGLHRVPLQRVQLGRNGRLQPFLDLPASTGRNPERIIELVNGTSLLPGTSSLTSTPFWLAAISACV